MTKAEIQEFIREAVEAARKAGTTWLTRSEWREIEYYLEDCFEAEDRPTGHWINYKDEHQCSNCRENVIDDWIDESDVYDFCPWCGADMRGNEE